MNHAPGTQSPEALAKEIRDHEESARRQQLRGVLGLTLYHNGNALNLDPAAMTSVSIEFAAEICALCAEALNSIEDEEEIFTKLVAAFKEELTTAWADSVTRWYSLNARWDDEVVLKKLEEVLNRSFSPEVTSKYLQQIREKWAAMSKKGA